MQSPIHTPVSRALGRTFGQSELPVQTPAPVRLDLYGPIHQTLRAAMAQTMVALGALDITDPAECAAVMSGARALLDLIDSHLRHEEEFVHPALQAAEPGIVAAIEGEHAEHRTAIAMLRSEIDTLARTPDSQAMVGLYRRFALFIAENHEHMHTEETQLAGILWASYTDAELAVIHDRIIASIPPAEMAGVLPLMLPALNPRQRAEMLRDIQSKAPPEAMSGVLAIAEQALDRAGWHKLQAALAY